ncbi:hypothetical protein MUP77_14820 [Candidatus Bathyarchaeota archaeon]|nr:hypothetical protein [Candidatus Bathyarchaeota archaeon]
MSSGSVVASTGTAPAQLLRTERVETIEKQTLELFPHQHEEFGRLESEIEELKKKVEGLGSKIEQPGTGSQKIVVIEQVSKEETLVRVETYFQEHGSADIEELMINLKLPVSDIIDAIDKLKREDKLEVAEERKT